MLHRRPRCHFPFGEIVVNASRVVCANPSGVCVRIIKRTTNKVPVRLKVVVGEKLGRY